MQQEQQEQQIDISAEAKVIRGVDGVSPIANVVQTSTGATITITDAEGTTTANITNGTNGTNGADGFSPIATVSKSGSTTTISITDKNGTTTATVSDGATYTAGDGISISGGVISVNYPNADVEAY